MSKSFAAACEKIDDKEGLEELLKECVRISWAFEDAQIQLGYGSASNIGIIAARLKDENLTDYDREVLTTALKRMSDICNSLAGQGVING